jgi:hypothetical protein
MFRIADSLALLAVEAGQVNNPSEQFGAAGTSRLDVEQRSINIGEPVPIAFGLRRENQGGILISPGASECRFENDVSNNVTAYYHLVLSEGRLGTILIEDIFQRACRVGEHAQGYNARAGFWLPGNFLVQRGQNPIPEATFICGSIGLYPDITTLSFKITIPAGFDQWKKQVHVFIRNGIRVSRFLELGKGPSDNFCDLVFYLLTSSKRVPEALIDVEQLALSAQFLEVNGLTCNCYLTEAQSYSDLIAKWSSYFLLTPSNRIGKQGLRPLLPTNSDGTIKTTAVSIEYTFDEDLILPGSFSIEYNSYADRQPFTAQMIWRQELGDEAAIIRTLEVSAPGVSENGPFESYDLSEFCTSENHAAKVGAYIVADRLFSSHLISFAVKPQSHQTLVRVGSIVRVLLTRLEPGGQPSRFDYLYQVQRIYKNFAGGTQYDCKHFPVNNERQSLTALAVAGAEGTGILLESPKTGVTCDTNTGTGGIDFGITVPLDFVLGSFDFDIEDFDIDNFLPLDDLNILIPDDIVFDLETDEFIWVSFDPPTNENWVFDLDRDEFVWAGDEPPIDYDPLIVGSINNPSSGSGPAVGAFNGGTTIPGIGGGGGFDFGGGGGFDFGGGGSFEVEGEGFGDPEPNPSDGGDATPVGPFVTPPVPGGAPGIPPAGICPGGEIERIIGNIGDEGNAIRETVTGYSLPLTPPEPLGGGDWNGKFAEFRIRCPNGEEQPIDPLTGDTEPGDFYQFPVQTITITTESFIYDNRKRCSTDAVITNSESFLQSTFSKSGVIGVSQNLGFTSTIGSGCGGTAQQEDIPTRKINWVLPDGSIEIQDVGTLTGQAISENAYGVRSHERYVVNISGSADGLIYQRLGRPPRHDLVRSLPIQR